MPKRQIRGKVGKQLYLNKIFNRGMLHTSSEMQEGYVKTISNFDITPTGDAATPRQPYAAVGFNNATLSKYTYPVQFQQASGLQHYVEFINTVSEKHFVGDIVEETPLSDPIKVYSRGGQDMANVIYSECLEGREFVKPLNISLASEEKLSMDDVQMAEHPDDLDVVLMDVPYETSVSNMVTTPVIFYNGRPWVYDGDDMMDLLIEDDTPNINVDRFHIKDFDTVDFYDINGNKTTVRLLGIDSPESGFPWYVYGAQVLHKYLSMASHIKLIRDGADTDSTDSERKLRWVAVSYDGLNFFLINAIGVKLGLAKVRYIYEAYKYTDMLIRCQTIAKQRGLLMWNEDIYDPLHTYKHNAVRLRNLPAGVNVEVLKIKYNKPVTFNLSNSIDQVEFKYIDYLDAIAFIGRVVSNNNVIYKGLMLLKCVMEDGYYNFDLEIAENDGEGYIPNINEALTTGYNLYNSQLVNVNNSTNTNYGTDILGVIATNPHNSEEIVLSAPTGASVNLHGVINESYFKLPTKASISGVKYSVSAQVEVMSSITIEWNDLNTDEHPNYKKIVLTYSNVNPTTYGANNTLVNTEKDFDFNYITIMTNEQLFKELVRDNKELTEWDYSLVINHDGVVEDGEIVPTKLPSRKRKITVQRFFKNLTFKLNITEPIQHQEVITIFRPEGQDEWYSEQRVNNAVDVFSYKFLSFGVQVSILSGGGGFGLKVINNTSDLNKAFEAEYQNLVERPQTIPTIILLSKWEVSEPTGEWRTIKEMYPHYTLQNSMLTPLKDNGVNLPNYIQHTIEGSSNMSFRYSLIPAYELNTGVYVYNEYAVMSHIYPSFKVSNTWETLSNEMLRRNLLLRNATRIGYYNRSIFLYGEHIKSNVVQFSMFEKAWYFPFPFYNIQVDEKIIHIHPHKNSLIIFGQYNIYMLMEGSSALEFPLFKIYENLSVDTTDINTVVSIGNNVMFFNKQVGYVIVPNRYTNDPTDVGVYKMTDNISNLLLSPDLFIRLRTRYAKDVLTQSIIGKFHTFVADNVINLIVSYTMNTEEDTLHLTVIYRYDQAFKYWSLYDISLGEEIHSPYICEPQIGYQFMMRKGDESYLLKPITTDLPLDFDSSRIDIGLDGLKPISVFIDSGYLSVDTMNDKRFKDLLFEFNNIEGATLTMFPNFYVDGAPQVLTDTQSIVGTPVGDYVIEGSQTPIVLKPANTQDLTGRQKFSQGFIIEGSFFTTSERVRVRIPVWGKGKMPSFTLAIESSAMYEFLNFSLIYKEKSITRR